MYSILYVAVGQIYQIGPFGSEQDAMEAARSASNDGEFDIMDTHVWLIRPDHSMTELTAIDLGVETEDDLEELRRMPGGD